MMASPSLLTGIGTTQENDIGDKKIAVIGLGYVGLPVAVEFGKSRPVIGFDISTGRIDALRAGNDATKEVSPEELASADQLTFTIEPSDLAEARVYIVLIARPDNKDVQKNIEMIKKAVSLESGEYLK
jgi:UDP-N-acetyl-D-glucosamine/UDP-N-acetyl-D-galactosamine dehydrogenase